MDSTNTQTGFMIWHPEVHFRFKEYLFYFMLRYKGYRREYLEELRNNLEEKNITGYCVYEVVGAYDIILRVWLTTNLLSEITKIFESISPLIAFPYFRVNKINHWGFEEAPSEDLLFKLYSHTEIVSKMQKQVQSGNFELFKEYNGVENKLVIFENTGLSVSKSAVKFYSALTFGETGIISKNQEKEIFDKLAIIKDNLKHTDGYVNKISIYSGENFAHVMVKGIADNIIAVKIFMINDIISPLRAYYPETTTFAICEDYPYESDNISEEALKISSWGTPPQWILSWFPEIYSLGGNKKIVTRITTILTDHQDTINAVPRSYLEKIIKPLLESAITENPEKAVGKILPWFSFVEATLSNDKVWFSFLRKLSGKEGKELPAINNEILKAADVDPNKKEYTLLDYLNKYLWAIRTYRKEEAEIFGKTPVKDLSDTRNEFAHGRIFRDFEKKWINVYDQFMWFIPFFEYILRMSKLEEKEN
jgi:hypothetical protein